MTTYIADIAHYNEVLAPKALREEIDINACDMASLYHDHFNIPKYKFKVYKK